MSNVRRNRCDGIAASGAQSPGHTEWQAQINTPTPNLFAQSALNAVYPTGTYTVLRCNTPLQSPSTVPAESLCHGPLYTLEPDSDGRAGQRAQACQVSRGWPKGAAPVYLFLPQQRDACCLQDPARAVFPAPPCTPTPLGHGPRMLPVLNTTHTVLQQHHDSQQLVCNFSVQQHTLCLPASCTVQHLVVDWTNPKGPTW